MANIANGVYSRYRNTVLYGNDGMLSWIIIPRFTKRQGKLAILLLILEDVESKTMRTGRLFQLCTFMLGRYVT